MQHLFPVVFLLQKQLICYDIAETVPPIISKFYLSEGTETKILDNDYTIRLYIRNNSINFFKNFKNNHLPLSKKSRSVSQQKATNLL